MKAPSPLLPALHRTLASVAEAEKLNPDDACLTQFKRSLLQMIAELEMRETQPSGIEAA